MTGCNEKIQNEIVMAVGDLFYESGLRVSDFGPLEINCFSICFWIDLEGPNGIEVVYVKVPKIIFYDKAKERLKDVSDEDRILAVNELNSLDYLRDFWGITCGVQFVESLGYIERYNALITKRVKADFLFKKFRLHDCYGSSRVKKFDSVKIALSNFGSALRSFHNNDFKVARYNLDDSVVKLEGYLHTLAQYGVRSSHLHRIRSVLSASKGFSCDGLLVNNLKGIDIRQIFVDGSELYIIDPGKISTGFQEADLARFVVTCRILYWGTTEILRRVCPSLSYENCFLDGYYGPDNRPDKMMKLLIIKEILKHWKMAHFSLSRRNWNTYIKFFLKKIYVDRFYYKLISDELSSLH